MTDASQAVLSWVEARQTASDRAPIPFQRLPPLIFVLGDASLEPTQIAALIDQVVAEILPRGDETAQRGPSTRFESRGEDRLVIRAGELTVDLGSHQAWWDGCLLPLTEQELRILASLVRGLGAVSFRDLSQEVWGHLYDGDPDFIRLAVKRLRRKLQAVKAGAHIEAVRGFGFRLST